MKDRLAYLEQLVAALEEEGLTEYSSSAQRVVEVWPYLQETLQALKGEQAELYELVATNIIVEVEDLLDKVRKEKKAQEIAWQREQERQREVLEAALQRFPELAAWEPTIHEHFGDYTITFETPWGQLRVEPHYDLDENRHPKYRFRLFASAHTGENREFQTVEDALTFLVVRHAMSQEKEEEKRRSEAERKAREEEARRRAEEERKKREEELARLRAQALSRTAKDWLKSAAIAAWVTKDYEVAQTYALIGLLAAFVEEDEFAAPFAPAAAADGPAIAVQ